MWFQLSSLFLWEDVGISCDSRNVIWKQRFKPNFSLPHPAWGKVDVFHLDICDSEVGAGTLPALRNFVFWRFFGHEMGKRLCWDHSIGTALKASDFLTQGKVFQASSFQLCIPPGCLSSSNPQNKQQPGGVSGTVPELGPEGWIWGSPAWAANKLLSFLTRDILPADPQPGAVLQITGQAEHPSILLKPAGAPCAQIKAKCLPLAHPKQLEELLVKARSHFQQCCHLKQVCDQREDWGTEGLDTAGSWQQNPGINDYTSLSPKREPEVWVNLQDIHPSDTQQKTPCKQSSFQSL